jgi:alpha-tubulin suppressor-like RCC1 family protein
VATRAVSSETARGWDQLRPVAVVGLDDAVLLGTGSEHACALRATGTLVCWGANDRGQLGNGGTTDEPLATPVTATSGAGVVAIAGNATSSCVLRSTGAVDCWGERSWSAGGGTAASAERVWSAGIRSIEGAGFGLHAISASDVLTYVGGAGWGYPYEPGPSTVWADVAGVTPLDAIDVAQGWDHSCAVVRDGTIRCFGRDEGKSGDGSPSDMQHNPPVVTLGVSGATAIAAGSGHTCALLASGAVSCWGSNSSGELGDGGPSGSSRLATSVATLSDATEIDAGWVHTCALRSDGSVWCWGGNNHGQLGTGDLGVRTTPAPVVGLPLP